MRQQISLETVVVLLLFCFSSIANPSPQDSSSQIRVFLEGLDAGDSPVVAGQRLRQPSLLSGFYRARDHAPLWLRGAPLEKEVTNLIAAIDESVGHGFLAERYHRSTIAKLLNTRDASSRHALDLLLTDAFLSQALHRGRVGSGAD